VSAEAATPDELRAFARLPQGLPPGVTPATLAPATDPAAEGEKK